MNPYRQPTQYPTGGGTVGREQRGFGQSTTPTIESKPGQSQVSPEMSKMMGKALRSYMSPTAAASNPGYGAAINSGMSGQAASMLTGGGAGAGLGAGGGLVGGSAGLGSGMSAGAASMLGGGGAGLGAGGATGTLYGGAGSMFGAGAGAGAGAGLGSAGAGAGGAGGAMSGAGAVAWPLAIAAALYGADQLMNEKGDDKWYSREKLNSLGSKDGKGFRVGDGLNMINPAAWLSDPSKAAQSAGNFFTLGLFD